MSKARRRAAWREDRNALITYLLSAVRRCDWHAASDAANDRVLEAKTP